MPETTRIEDTLIRGYRQLALETPARPRDFVLRALDVVLASLFLLLSLPVSLTIAVLVLVTSGRPVLYRGERVGRGARVFTMYKFRTLQRGAETRLGPYLGEELVSRTQGEFTQVGRWLKATQLDEIPQFVNVLRGDMSLVGPRPLPVRDYNGFSQDWHRRRFSVRPGITCLWQVNGRSRLPFERWMELDMEYIDQWSLWLDIKILMKTFAAVLRQSGAA